MVLQKLWFHKVLTDYVILMQATLLQIFIQENPENHELNVVLLYTYAEFYHPEMIKVKLIYILANI